MNKPNGCNWGEPSLEFLAAGPPAAELPVECFGNADGYLTHVQAEGDLQIDYAASGLLVLVGALIGKCFSVQIQNSWSEPLVVWCAMVGPPASGKTPAAAPTKTATLSEERKLHRKFSDWLDADKAAELDDNDLVEELRQRPPRYLAQDTTIEALAFIEHNSPYGLLVERDELSSLTSNRSRYSGGDDRPFYLEAWGSGAYKKDRVGSGSLSIENHLFALWGGIQPDVLKPMSQDDAADDGFLGRFLVFFPCLKPPGPLRAGADHSSLRAAADRLSNWNDGNMDQVDHTQLTLSEDARSTFDKWRQTEHAGRYFESCKMGTAFRKLDIQLTRLAGVLLMLDWAFSDDEDLDLVVSGGIMNRAIRLVEEYFVPHIERVYAIADRDPVADMAGNILRAICTARIMDFRLREVRRTWKLPGSSATNAAGLMEKAANLLEQCECICRDPSKKGDFYVVNPELLDDALPFIRIVLDSERN